MGSQQTTKSADSRTTKRPEWRDKFLTALVATHGNVVKAGKLSGVGHSTLYEHRQADEQFALEWADALTEAKSALIEHTLRWAFGELRKVTIIRKRNKETGELEVVMEREEPDRAPGVTIFALKNIAGWTDRVQVDGIHPDAAFAAFTRLADLIREDKRDEFDLIMAELAEAKA